MKSLLNIKDILILFLVFIIAATYAILNVNFSLPPFEDAAILMRYALHFSSGYGVVWNIGEAPVDGATDFLFMVVVGLFSKTGLSIESSVRIITLVSHFATIFLIYYTIIKLEKGSRTIAGFSAIYFSLGPGFYLIAAGFGTSFFVLFSAINFYYVIKIILNETKNDFLFFSFSSLITSLIRPEGLILTVLMLASIINMKGFKSSKKVVSTFTIIFLVIGGVYFVWRWNYFGYPLPNPFYVKGGGKIFLSSLKVSVFNAFTLSLPFLVFFVFGLFSPTTRRIAFSLLVPIIGFISAFSLLNNDMNFSFRFQYASLPLILMSWYPLTYSIRNKFDFTVWKKKNIFQNILIWFLIVTVTLGSLLYIVDTGHEKYFHDGRFDIAKCLSKYKNKNYTLATTEAGLLSFYSGWKSIDTWGLNDKWIAHNGMVTEAYLYKYKPQLIVFHASFTPLSMKKMKIGKWHEMTLILKKYAEENNYILAAAYGVDKTESFYYYVKKDFTHSDEIVKKIKYANYSWFDSGTQAKNFILENEQKKSN